MKRANLRGLIFVIVLMMSVALCAAKTNEDAEKYSTAGEFELVNGDYKGAIKDYNKAFELNKENYKDYYYRGIAKKLSGDEKGANTDFNIAKKSGHVSDKRIKSELIRYKLMHETLGDRSESFNPQNLIVPKLIEKTPECLNGKFKGVSGMPVRIFGLDINNDNKEEYLVHGFYKDDKPTSNWYAKYIYFVNSDGEIKTRKYWDWPMGFSYNWFAKLDNGPMLYYLQLDGDADDSDYKLFSFDPESWKIKCVFEINPVIVDETRWNKVFWGYPSDIQDLIIKKENGTIKILAAFDKQKENGNEGSTPYIFFKGHTTQPETGEYKEFRNINTYYTLDELIKKHKDLETEFKMNKHAH